MQVGGWIARLISVLLAVSRAIRLMPSAACAPLPKESTRGGMRSTIIKLSSPVNSTSVEVSSYEGIRPLTILDRCLLEKTPEVDAL